MTTFIKTKFKKLDDQTNIDNYRVVAKITEYHIISKLIFFKIIISKLMNIRQLFNEIKVCKNIKNQQVYNGRKDLNVSYGWTD